MSTPEAVQAGVSTVEGLSRLDRPAKAAAAKVRDLLPAGPVKDAVSGT